MKKSGWIIIVGIIILSLLIYKIGLENIFNTLKNFNLLFLPLIIIVLIISYILAGINIWVLIKPYKKISILKPIKYVFFTLFYSSFTPGKIADFFMIFYLKKNKLSVSKSTIITIFDKIISLILKSLLGIVGAIFILKKFDLLTLGVPIIMIFLLIFLFIFLSSRKLRDLIKKFILRKYSKIFKGFSKDLKKYIKNNKKELFYNLLITLVKTIFETALLYLLFLSFGQSINFIKILLIFSLLSIISFIAFPIGISGFGIREALGIIMYSTINVDPAIVFSSYMIRLLLIYVINLLTFIYYPSELNLIKKYNFLKKVRFK